MNKPTALEYLVGCYGERTEVAAELLLSGLLLPTQPSLALLLFQADSTEHSKGQIKPKADLHSVDSPKKQMSGFVLFCFLP